ncbi:MAG: DUF2169 domain-containing protein [Pseudomonadota bacterium]
MRLFKPRRLSVMTRPLEEPPHFLFVVTSFLMFDIDEPDVPLLDQALWPFVAEQLDGRALDVGMPKPFGEFMVIGDAIAPNERPQQAMWVEIKLAGREKVARVFGDRLWTIDQDTGEVRMTDPAPFLRMPLNPSHAFGGLAFEKNPLGRGFGAAAALAQGESVPLPNIEDPETLMLSPEEVVEPLFLAALDAAWPQRRDRLGTFDKAWLEKQHPGHPLDTDWSFYNEAPKDQWLDGFFTGDETYEIYGMDKTGQGVTGRLPDLYPRIFVKRSSAESGLVELQGRADTLWLFPNHRKGVLAFRAVTDCADEDASDVECVMAACERRSDRTRPIDYYAEEYLKRTDPETGAFHLTNDSALMPPLPQAVLEERARRRQELQREQAETYRKNRLARMERALAQAGLPGVLNLSAAPPTPEVDDILDSMPVFLPEELESGDVDLSEIIEWSKRVSPDDSDLFEKFKQNPNAIKDNPIAFLRNPEDAAAMIPPEALRPVEAPEASEEIKQQESKRVMNPPTLPGGADLEAALEDMLKEIEALPDPAERPSKDIARKMLPEHPLFNQDRLAAAINQEPEGPVAPENLSETIRTATVDAAKSLAEARRMSPYPLAPEDPLHPEVAAHIGQVVLAELGRGQSLAGHDLAGSNLRGAKLAGQNLRACLLEKSDLRNADLRGANLEGATLAGANMDDADLTGANLTGANLSMVSARRASFAGVTLDAPIAMLEADFGGACFADASLSNTQILKCLLHDVDFQRADLNEVVFMQCDLSRLKAAGARGYRLIFLEAVLNQADFTDARLERSALLNSEMARSRFDGAELLRFVVMGGRSLVASSFRKATLRSASIRDSDLSESDFSGALLETVDFSGITARGTDFVYAVLNQVMLGRANLDACNFLGAKILECQLKRVSLNGASLAQARLYGVNGDKVTAEQLDLTDASIQLSQLRDEERRPLL